MLTSDWFNKKADVGIILNDHMYSFLLVFEWVKLFCYNLVLMRYCVIFLLPLDGGLKECILTIVFLQNSNSNSALRLHWALFLPFNAFIIMLLVLFPVPLCLLTLGGVAVLGLTIRKRGCNFFLESLQIQLLYSFLYVNHVWL